MAIRYALNQWRDFGRRGQVYVEVRGLHSEQSIRTRVTGLPGPLAISVPGTNWSCSYASLGPAKPTPNALHTIPYPMFLHSLECVNGGAGSSVSIECPTTMTDLAKELGTKLRLAQTLVLIERNNGQERRSFAEILCEP
jgi:hypothetical protein